MHVATDLSEVAKFDAQAESWWDPDGPAKALHDLNPVRLRYIESLAPIAGARILDIGCGAGILAEALARSGGIVTGIDLAESSIRIAREHARAEGVDVDYQCTEIGKFVAEHQREFDIVTCLELIEHVPDQDSLVQCCAIAARPKGHVFFSTINRNPKSFLLAIVAAEYVLNIVPRGSHRYRNLLRPSELAAACRRAGLTIEDMSGLTYNPLLRECHLGPDIDVNYLCHCVAP